MFQWAFALLVLAVAFPSQAVTVRLEAYVSFALLDDSSVPLADNSVIQIIGSLDGTADGFEESDSRPDCFNAHSTLGDDIILAQIVVDSSILASNGTFFSTHFFDSTQVANVYIRFFDFQERLISSTNPIAYGVSALYSVTNHPGDQVFVDFAPTATLSADQSKKFLLVPEPSTTNLLLLFGWIGFWMRSRLRPSSKTRRGASLRPHRDSS